MTPLEQRLVTDLWTALGGPPASLDALDVSGAEGGLPSPYLVSEAALAEVAVATLAVAELQAARRGEPAPRAHVDRRHVAAAFRSERYIHPLGWTIPPVWDPIAGDYRARDRWIRLHTNYASHRAAVIRVLGVEPTRDAVRAAVAAWSAEELEGAVVAAGGCAARMRAREEWLVHPQGIAVDGEPLVAVDRAPATVEERRPDDAPLAGVRVLDLTRVIAGPVCTRFLSAYGADVVRVDPPGFAEVGALLGETTGGKRRVALDLRAAADRAAFDRLVAGADVLVCGYRSDALDRLGYPLAALRALRPALIVTSLDAYGWSGPWKGRRGFDSLVQMSTGIVARTTELAASAEPRSLPAQALDHGTGYLLAAATCRALTHRLVHRETSHLRLSLAATAAWLTELGEEGDPRGRDFTADDAALWHERTESAWGPLERVRCPGRIEGYEPRWSIAPGPLGVDPPLWP